MFGRHVILHASTYKIVQELGDLTDSDQDNVRMPDHMEQIHCRIKDNLVKAHQKQCRHYNLRSRLNEFAPGQLVFRRNFSLSDKGEYFNVKLARKLVPCKIIEKIGYCLYGVQDLDNELIRRFHDKDLQATS